MEECIVESNNKLKEKIGSLKIGERIRKIDVQKVPVIGKSKFIKTKKGKMITAGILALLIAGSAFTATYVLGKDTVSAYSEYQVATSDIQVVISGSGTVEPINMYNIVALVQGDVLAADFEEGDSVAEDQLLYVIDSSDMETTLEKSMISLQKATMTYQDSADAAGNLNVKSPIAGKVGTVSVARNDAISQGSQIATVYDDSTLTLKVPFAESDTAGLKAGQTVSVIIDTTFEALSGKITKVYDSKRVLEGSQTVTDVEVTVNNPGALTSGIYATVNAGGATSYEGGELQYANEKIITADSSGTIDKVYCTEGQYVKAGTVLVKMSSDSATNDYQSGVLTLRDAQLSYESTQKQLDNYNITAPIAGTIIEKSVKAGDIIETSDSAQTVLAVIADMSTMTFEIDVDELDIAKMQEGQTVNITADALPNNTFTGTVENVGINGVTADGVTSYPVKIVIDKPEGLLPGMNVNADIVVESATDILSIPVTAVNRGNTVLVADDGSKTQSKAASQGGPSTQASVSDVPTGYISVTVELGISDDSYIEVISGLAEGDIILVPVEAASDSTETTTETAVPGMGGAMSGGAPPDGGGGPPAN
jgi:HlyD family secretion protein